MNIVTMFPKSSYSENNHDYTKPAWPRHHQTIRMNNSGILNDREKDTFNLVRKVNNRKRAYFSIDFESGHGGEGDVIAHVDTESPKSA